MKTFRNAQGKIVGELNDDVYISKRSKSKHLLRVMDAWGIDKSILKELEEEGCERIEIYDEENEEMYGIALETLKEKGVERNFVGPQIFLPRKYWDRLPT